ncbi:MAG: carboxypeptidase-like regulatory domain-containing protein [Planctomycetota bacterium]|nr:carboxypeptidase-like regulatory domain-containing protein [Planctomycetota bacterium]
MGCSKGVPEFAKDLVAVSGTVTMDSKPLEGAMVTYIAQDGPSRSSTAMTDASGQYSMTTPTAGEGILPGAYTVIISKLLMPDGSPIPPDTAPMDVGAEELLPEKYSSVAAPTLSAEVGKLGGKFDFELTAM